MNKGLGAASLMLGALLLAGCNGQAKTTCYGTEPDGEVEKLQPCPNGWPNGSKRKIGEDEFKHLEAVDLKKIKQKGF